MSEHNHHHHHHGSSDEKIGLAFFLNLIFSIIEIIGGLLTNSVSIISDSVHDFGDAFSIGISWLLEKKSKSKPNEKYTFGYKRFSVLGALINSAVLLVGATLILVNTVPRLIHPVKADYSGMIILAVIGVIINGIAAFSTSKGEGLNEKAVSLHLFEDVFGWIAVLIGSIVMRFWNIPIIDPIISLVITVFILINVIKNLKQIFDVFLEKAPETIDINALKADLMECDNVESIHHLHLWTTDGTDAFATIHAVVKEGSNIETIKIDLREKAKKSGILHITIECEYENEKCCHIECE